MNSQQIACFLAAGRSPNFAEAAAKLYMSQPTFSRTIASLEQELGFSLFVRSYKSTQLTPAGAVMLDGLTKLSQSYSDLVDTARRTSEHVTGTLTIGILEGQMILSALHDIIQALSREHPQVELVLLRLNFHDLIERLYAHSIDVGVTLTLDIEQQEHISHLELESLSNYLVIPRDHPKASRSGLSLADFADNTFIEIDRSESPVISQLMYHSCLDAGFVPNMLVAPDLKTQILWLEAGRGIAAFNQSHVACHNPNLTAIPIPELPKVSFSAAWHMENYNPTISLFMSHLKLE